MFKQCTIVLLDRKHINRPGKSCDRRDRRSRETFRIWGNFGKIISFPLGKFYIFPLASFFISPFWEFLISPLGKFLISPLGEVINLPFGEIPQRWCCFLVETRKKFSFSQTRFFLAMCRPVVWLRRDVAGGRRRGSERGWGGWRAEGGGGGGGGQAAATGQGTRK